MRLLSILSLTVPAPDPVAAQAWWADNLGAIAAEDETGALEVNDVVVRHGDRLEIEIVAADLDSGGATVTDPGGTTIRLVPPDVAAQQQAEDSIREFVSSAAELDGPAVDELVAAVTAIMTTANDQLAELLTDLPNNKVLATMLAVGQRAREVAPDNAQWRLHAASTMLSGFLTAANS
jgi:hypothetical protein